MACSSTGPTRNGFGWPVFDERPLQLQRPATGVHQADEPSLAEPLTYTLASLKDSDPQPLSRLTEVPFAINKAFGHDYGPAVSDQRHRFVFNGIWAAAYGIQLSGVYFYGSGERFAVTRAPASVTR